MKLPKEQCERSKEKSDFFKQTIYLVRHGETDANVQNIYQGRGFDPPSNETGRDQVYRLAAFLEKEAGDTNTIYTSPLKRAMDTMAIIAHVLSKEGRLDSEGRLLPRMIIERDLYEIDHGDWDGKTYDYVKKIWPAIAGTWWHGNQNLVEFPNGESIVGARERVIAQFTKILEKNTEEKIIIVAHGGTNALILAHLLKTTFFRPIKQSNACLNIIERQMENGMESFKIALMNGTAHLDAD